MIYRFGAGYELDLVRYELRRGSAPVHVEPQVFDVLAHLVSNRDRVVSKDELLDEIWGDRFVSESALTTRLKAARQAVGDDGRTQALIRTVHGRGYQFHGAVSETTGPGERSEPDQSGIPRPQGPIFGRDEDLAALSAVVTAERLTTILGPGGIGKTRLVTEFALGWPAERSAIAYVELAPVVGSAAVTDALASALSIQVGQRTDLRQACAEYLRAVEHLLVIDNCEHVRVATADLLDHLLRYCPDLRVVTTSRVPLGLASEMLFRLEPLPVPDAGAEAVADSAIVSLFARRARRADHTFTLEDENVEKVRSLCHALDGLPLAVELAAGRLGAFELDDLRERLDRRLDLLSGSPESGEHRHRTLRATLDWSYELLDADAQTLLRHLAVFPSGVTLTGAEWVGQRIGLSDDPAAVLSRLVDASVVVRRPGRSGVRYLQLDTIRAFGLDLLDQCGERPAAEALLVEWARELGRQIEAGTKSRDEAEWDDRIRRSKPNLRAARQLMLDQGDIAAAAALSWNLDRWARFRGQSEVWRWAEELDQLGDALPSEWRNRVAAMTSQYAWLQGRLDEAERLARDVLERDPRPEERHLALTSLGTVQMWQGNFAGAVETWTIGAEMVPIPGGDYASGALAEAYRGRFDRGRDLIARARARDAGAGAPSELCWIEYCAGELEATAGTGDHESHLDIAISEARRLGCSFILGVAMVTQASHRARAGETAGAAESYLELLDLWLRSGSWTQLWTTLRNIAELLTGTDDETALRLWAAADVDPQASLLTGDPQKRRISHRDEILGRLGAESVERIEAEARAAERTSLVDEAVVALRDLTRLDAATGDPRGSTSGSSAPSASEPRRARGRPGPSEA